MFDEIKRRLKNGEKVELECIDREGIVKEKYGKVNKRIINRESIVIKSVSEHTGIMYLEGNRPQIESDGLLPRELKYFKIKEPAPTFDDLVGVAVQAAKDGLLEINMLNSEFITASIPGDHDSAFVTCWRTKQEIFESSINKVESLYTETFVIEGEEDISKVKSGAEVVLTNGSRGIAESQHCHSGESFLHVVSGDYSTYLYLFSLKGATVTQRKTNN